MNDDDRAKLYWALLRGMAKIAQDQLCARDEHHDWGPAIATAHYPDIPILPITDKPVPNDTAYRVSYTRTCQNCGKEKTFTE